MKQPELGAAVVSGAGSGIGRAVAVALGARGHSLVLLGRRAEPLGETLRLAGAPGSVMPCDVRDAEAVAAVAETALAKWGPPDLLVPAAGVASVGHYGELAPEALAAMLATNVGGTFHLLRSFLPAMVEAGRGRVIPILSQAARRTYPGWGGYCASKWALLGLVETLRQELAGTGVTVTSLLPGATDTPIWDGLGAGWDRSRMVPPEEVARALVYALDAPASTLVEEIQMGPAGGAL